MSKMTYPEFLRELAKHVTDDEMYLCCHLDGSYAEDRVSSGTLHPLSYMSLLKEKKHIEKLAQTIAKKMKRKPNHGTTLSESLGYRDEGGAEGRQKWLEKLAKRAEKVAA